MIKLEAFSENAPRGSCSMLKKLGAGETGFGGTEFGRGEMSIDEYLRHTVKETEAKNLPEGRVPQTTFWIVEDDLAVGMLRMRHSLNAVTRVHGGHIGYYIRPSARSKGFGTKALGIALEEIARVGVSSVMLTTNPGNTASIRVIEENGGVLKAQVPESDGSDIINQYWIELS